jgi:hypothetical protein
MSTTILDTTLERVVPNAVKYRQYTHHNGRMWLRSIALIVDVIAFSAALTLATGIRIWAFAVLITPFVWCIMFSAGESFG